MYNIDPEVSMGFVEDFVFDPKIPKVTEESMNEANAVLDKPFDFFSSYLQLAQYKKADILKSVTIKKKLLLKWT